MRYYIASRIENAERVKELHALFRAAGWSCTYDWSVHGSVRGEGVTRETLSRVALAEMNGVTDADVVIVLLPGGRGTHVEMGAAIAVETPLVLWSPDPERDFSCDERTSAFYHVEWIQHRSDPSMPALAEYLIDKYGGRKWSRDEVEARYKEMVDDER